MSWESSTFGRWIPCNLQVFCRFEAPEVGLIRSMLSFESFGTYFLVEMDDSLNGPISMGVGQACQKSWVGYRSHTIFTEWFAAICWGRPLWRMTQALRTSHCANCIMGVQRRVFSGDCYCKYRTEHTAFVACLNFILTDFDCCLSRNQLLLICTYLYHLTGNNRKDEEKFYTVLDEASQSPVVLPLSVSACSQWNESPSKTPTKHLDVAEALVNWCLQCFWKFGWKKISPPNALQQERNHDDCWLLTESRRFLVAHRWAWQTSWAVWKGLLVAV